MAKFLFLALIALCVSFTTAQVQLGNFIGYDYSAGKRGATLAEIASTPPTNFPGDGHAKQHDMDWRIQNVDNDRHRQMNVHQAAFDRMMGNHFQAVQDWQF